MNVAEIIPLILNNSPTIIPTIGDITGAIFTAIFLRKNTETKEFEKIKAGQFKEVISDLLNSGKMTYVEYYKTKNFLDIAKKADEFYSKSNHTNEQKTYDFDWFFRYYEAAGNVSDEKMQDLWAKILAGEIDTPNSFPLKTIDILKNLGKKDAELFDKICMHSIHGNSHYFLPNYEKYFEHCNIRYNDILQLSEQGLIYDNSLLNEKIGISKKLKVVYSNDNLIITAQTSDEKVENINISQLPFTTVGFKIASLKKLNTTDDDFIFFAKQINTNEKINIGVYKITKKIDNRIIYDEENMINQ